MKVKELIKILKTFPKDAIVIGFGDTQYDEYGEPTNYGQLPMYHFSEPWLSHGKSVVFLPTDEDRELEYDEKNDLLPKEIMKGKKFKLKGFKKSKRSLWLF